MLFEPLLLAHWRERISVLAAGHRRRQAAESTVENRIKDSILTIITADFLNIIPPFVRS